MTRIDFKSKSFFANGNQYVIVDHITVGRDVRYTNLVPKLAFGTDFAGIFKTFSQIYEMATTGDSPLAALHNIATYAINAMDAVKNIGESGFPLYYELAAIFVNKVGENPNELTDQQIEEKIKDWALEGIPREDFFQLAISSIKELSKIWQAMQEEVAIQTNILNNSDIISN